jgi:HEAT repeat protein
MNRLVIIFLPALAILVSFIVLLGVLTRSEDDSPFDVMTKGEIEHQVRLTAENTVRSWSIAYKEAKDKSRVPHFQVFADAESRKLGFRDWIDMSCKGEKALGEKHWKAFYPAMLTRYDKRLRAVVDASSSNSANRSSIDASTANRVSELIDLLIRIKDKRDEENLQRLMLATKELSGIGKKGVEPLLEALDDKRPWVRAIAAWALGEIADKRAVKPLLKALRDQNENVRMKAGMALVAIGDDSIFEPMLASLKDKHPEVRGAACLALAEIRHESSVGPLMEALKDEDERVRDQAAWALAKIGKPALQRLIMALEDPNRDVRCLAMETLGEIGDKRAVDSIIKMLKDVEVTIRFGAAHVLGGFGDKKAVNPLIEALKDKDKTVRFWAVNSLEQIADTRAIKPLVDALKDKDDLVRGAAAGALKEIGDETAIASLVDTLKDEKKWIRESAAEALVKITKQGFSSYDDWKHWSETEWKPKHVGGK